MSGAVFRSYWKTQEIKLTSFGKGKLPDTVEQKTHYIRPTVSCSANACMSALVENTVPTASQSTNCAPVINASEIGTTQCDQIRAEENKWNTIRTDLQIAYVETSCHSATRMCVACQVLENDCSSPKPAVIICEDCRPNNFYCQQCCYYVHTFIPFHIPKIWHVSWFVCNLIFLKHCFW
jgi:hypothetical protein